jgi:hypothetical protein
MRMNLKTFMNKPRIVGDDMKDKFSEMQEMLLLPLVMYYLHYSLGLSLSWHYVTYTILYDQICHRHLHLVIDRVCVICVLFV